jgi:MFS family permease
METMPERTAPITERNTTEERYKWRILWSVIIGLFMVILDSTVINVALRALQIHFSVTTDQAQWVISLYTLVLGVSTPLSGYLADRFGTKRIYLGGLALFAFGSLLAGLSSSQGSLLFLIIARGVQGLGGVISLP